MNNRVTIPSKKQRDEWRDKRGHGMVSAVGEYTPEEFWLLLDAVDYLEGIEAALILLAERSYMALMARDLGQAGLWHKMIAEALLPLGEQRSSEEVKRILANEMFDRCSRTARVRAGNDKIEASRDLLIELKTGIIEAICSEDGLDGLDGAHLLSHLNSLLGLPADDHGVKDVEPDLNIEIFLSEVGYQADFSDDHGHRISSTMDFPSDKPVKFWKDQIELAILMALNEVRLVIERR